MAAVRWNIWWLHTPQSGTEVYSPSSDHTDYLSWICMTHLTASVSIWNGFKLFSFYTCVLNSSKARLFTCFCSSFHVSKNCRPQWGLQTNTAVCFLCVADLKPWDIWCDVSKFLYISESQVVSFLLSESTELSCVVIPRKRDRRLYLFVFIVSFLRTVGHSEFKEIQYISFLYVADLKSWDFYLLCVCHFFIHLRSKYFPK